jgi:Bacterial type II and III secretion system protein
MRSWRRHWFAVAGLIPGIAAAQDLEGNAKLDATELPQHIVKILRTTNKAQTNRYFPRVYEFKNVNPYAVVRWVRRFMEIEEGAWFSYCNDDGKSGKILAVCPEYQLEGLDALMALIDRTGLTSSGGDKRGMYQPKHRDVNDVGFLNNIVLAGTPTVVAVPDTQINGMYLEDSPSGFTSVEKAWAELDVPTGSFDAMTTVYEVDLNDDSQIGLDYQTWKNGPGRNLFAVGAFGTKEKVTEFNSEAQAGGAGSLIYNSGKNVYTLDDQEYEHTGRNGAYMYDVPSAYFDYLANNGFGRTMTRAKLAALSGTTALIEIGEEILYYKVNHAPDLRAGARLEPLDPYGKLEPFTDTTATGEVTDTYGVRVADHPDNRTVVPTLTKRELGTVKTGLSLQITPTVHANIVTVVFKMSFVDVTGFSDDGTPVLANRAAESTFRIPYDQREITIGGMVRNRRIDGANQMPGLGDIPILGYLFGGKSQLDQKSLVVVSMKMNASAMPGDNRSDEERAAEAKGLGDADAPPPENSAGFKPN